MNLLHRVIIVVSVLSTVSYPVALGQPRTPVKINKEGVLGGLIWLAQQQKPDGSFGEENEPTSEKHLTKIGLTGLALLPFTGAGFDTSSREVYDGICFGDVIRKGAVYLLTMCQYPDGCFGDRDQKNFIDNHTLATLALVDLYAMAKDTPAGCLFRDPAQKGITFLAKVPDSVIPVDNLIWIMLLLRFAHECNLEISDLVQCTWSWTNELGHQNKYINRELENKIKAWITKLGAEDWKEREGATQELINVGEVVLSFLNEEERHPDPEVRLRVKFIRSRLAEIATVSPESMICKHYLSPDDFLGGKGKWVEALTKKLPQWEQKDFLYWFFGGMALYYMIGDRRDSLKIWNEALKDTLLEHQIPWDEKDKTHGSWPPVGLNDIKNNRIYVTSLATMALETYYKKR